MITCTINPLRREGCTFYSQLKVWICLHLSMPKILNVHVRQDATVSLLRLHIAICASHGILTVSAIAIAIRLRLRTRLTPGWLASPGKPRSFGERESNPFYRYLYLHLLFHKLQQTLRSIFCADGMLPYRYFLYTILSRTFGIWLNTRLLSMHGPSTSELLRTLWMNGCFQANILAVTGTTLR